MEMLYTKYHNDIINTMEKEGFFDVSVEGRYDTNNIRKNIADNIIITASFISGTINNSEVNLIDTSDNYFVVGISYTNMVNNIVIATLSNKMFLNYGEENLYKMTISLKRKKAKINDSAKEIIDILNNSALSFFVDEEIPYNITIDDDIKELNIRIRFSAENKKAFNYALSGLDKKLELIGLELFKIDYKNITEGSPYKTLDKLDDIFEENYEDTIDVYFYCGY